MTTLDHFVFRGLSVHLTLLSWNRYNESDGTTSKVDYPVDDVLVFDVETLVMYQNCPVMAVAVSSDSW